MGKRRENLTSNLTVEEIVETARRDLMREGAREERGEGSGEIAPELEWQDALMSVIGSDVRSGERVVMVKCERKVWEVLALTATGMRRIGACPNRGHAKLIAERWWNEERERRECGGL